MQNIQKISILCILFLCLSAFAETVTFQYGSGATWNGELGQTVTVEFTDRGKSKQIEGPITKVKNDYIYVDGELIFITDIVSISGSTQTAETREPTSGAGEADDSNTATTIAKTPEKDGDLPMCVFFLPMEGGVGETMRATELEVLVEYIDENYGPGQVIILKVDSSGGYGATWSDLKDVIFRVRENHRIIAWIESAISAAAMTVYCCDEIYYTSMGEVGSCTGWSVSPTNPLSPEGQNIMIHEMEKVLARSSRTPYLAACMFRQHKWLTYDKDPETGEITYYDTVGGEGEYPLSTGNNITLTANQALKSGLCDGIANTEEELITLLQLENAEINLYGVELFDNWKKSFLEFQDTSQELYTIFQNGDPSADTEKKQITSQIKAGEKLLKWSKKLGEVARYSGLDEDRVKMLKRTILDLRRQLKNAPDE